ncbi:DNA-directed RNA polymerase, mitochondrial [Smittium mucronatum]|uniref:DNA-directed RNA polymerase n=1 Tax=Smittium mucronatum TaxID=133383 RepID=A0A1R0H2B9_9FUNG|nr:DNA-directed RNA polymerase, mitochondrial [Smittium mucronatum]
MYLQNIGLLSARPYINLKNGIAAKNQFLSFHTTTRDFNPFNYSSSLSRVQLCSNLVNKSYPSLKHNLPKNGIFRRNLVETTPKPFPQMVSIASPPKKIDSLLSKGSSNISKNTLDSYSNSIVRLEHQSITESLLQEIEADEAIRDQISVAHACLSSGNVDRGRRMIIGLYNLHRSKMKSMINVNLHNSIIKSLLESNPVRAHDALGWYKKMQADYEIIPDSNTFGILMHGYLNSGLNNLVILLIEEFERLGNSLDILVLSPFLTDSDLAKIKELSNGRFENKIGTLNNVLEKSLGMEIGSSLASHQNSSDSFPLRSESSQSSEIDSSSIKLDTQKIGLHMFNKIINQEKKVNPETPISSSSTPTSELPQPISVKSTKGEVLGVKLLRKMLDPLYKKEFSLYERQVLLETEAFDAAAARMKAESTMHGDGLLNLQSSTVQKLMAKWLPKLTLLIEDEVRRCDHIGSDRERSFYSPFLKLLPPEKIATVVVMEFVRTVMNRVISGDGAKGPPDSVIISRLITHIGKSVQSEYNLISLKKKENSHLLARNVEIQNLSANGKLFNIAVRNAQAKMQDELQKTSTWIPKWPTLVTVKLGSLFTAMLIEVAKIETSVLDTTTNTYTTQLVPAFTHSYWINKGYRIGVIKVHNEFSSLLTDEPIKELFNARFLPMIVPPKPWLSYNNGGYLTYQTYCMRTKNSTEQLSYLEHSSKQNKLTQVLSGLDVLGLTKWAINRPVFEIVLKVWNSGKGLAGIPPSVVKIQEPEKPDDIENNPKVFYEWANKVKMAKREFSNNHSMRCDVNYKVAIAHAFLDLPLYFPHDFDFRGRAYPIPPHFNNLGNDLCRGLLKFHDPKPLGERGLYWLRIQLANSFGYDKFSHDERIAFSIDNYEHILDSAKNPLNGKCWWMKSENPWQTLAACFELVAALESGDPYNYPSTLHVHQDGTCNGLQHYAALGRDLEGAKKVNLVPSERPQDVYTAILNIVEKEIEKDCKDNLREALLLRGKIKRKVIKQTVMTNVYGVTIIGAREQIEARLREVMDPNTDSPLFSNSDLGKLSLYLAKKVFISLGQIFECARLIQDWLNEAANRIAKSLPPDSFQLQKKLKNEKLKKNRISNLSKKNKLAIAAGSSTAKSSSIESDPATSDSLPSKTPALDEDSKDKKPTYKIGKSSNIVFKRKNILDDLIAKPMSSVIWTTPLGLTVVQPYRRFVVKNISSTLQSLAIIDHSIPSPVHPRKQSTAFPPNFIHSLDASHMILSALSCYDQGITFASVHDSYWTHACDVDIMNDVLRTEFVKLHSNKILENLKSEFETRYGDFLIPIVENQIIDPNQTKAKKSVKAKSKSKKDKKSASNASADIETESAEKVLSDSKDSITENDVSELPAHLQDMFKNSGEESFNSAASDKIGDLVPSGNGLEGTHSPANGDNGAALQETVKGLKVRKVIKWVPFSLPDLPGTGELDINEVYKSPYFFS